MSTVIIAVIVVAVIVVGVVVFGVMGVLRRRRLQERFGPEYDRVVGERGRRRMLSYSASPGSWDDHAAAEALSGWPAPRRGMGRRAVVVLACHEAPVRTGDAR